MKKSFLLPAAVLLVVYGFWDGAVLLSNSDIFPRPYQVFLGIAELIQRGVLLKYAVASLFRDLLIRRLERFEEVKWGYFGGN